MSEVKELITTEELSRRLKIDRITIWKLSKQNIIKGRIKIGKSVRFDWDAVLANLKENTIAEPV
jgi:hypothetical protein